MVRMVGLAASLDETSEDALSIHGSLDFLKGRASPERVTLEGELWQAMTTYPSYLAR